MVFIRKKVFGSRKKPNRMVLTTIMRRLVEIGQFKRKKEDGFDKSGKKMQVIVYERL